MAEEIIDLKDALERVQDDMELLIELFDIFEGDFVDKRPTIEEMIASGNAEEVRNLSHSLKGASGNISAKILYQALFAMEKKAADGDLTDMSELLKEVDVAFRAFQEKAAEIRRTS